MCSDFVWKVVEADKATAFAGALWTIYEQLSKFGNVSDMLAKVRISTFAHCLKSLGMQRFNCRDPTSHEIKQLVYLPDIVAHITDQLYSDCGWTK
eukprot:631638-Pyramimonas_sp.AAC.1